jgi:transcriptional regulator with XRE-family HTH domain
MNILEIKKGYGERLRELRAVRGLTQTALGKKTNLTKAAIVNIEKGASFPQPANRKKFATLFGTDEMLFQKGAPKPIPTDRLASLRTEIENYDVIRPAPDVHIFVNPDLPLEQKQIVQELGMELRRRLMEKKRN